MINVLLCDDHRLVIEGMQLILSNLPDIALKDVAFTGEEAIEKINQHPIDVLLLDIHLPGKNGLDICKIITSTHPSIKVIALTMSKDLSLIKLMLKNGASGYILKNANKEEVIEAIYSVSAGKRYLDKEVNELIVNDISSSKSAGSKNLLPSFSRREKEILQLIMDEFTNQEIADKLFISLGTVETHRRNMLAKVGARNTAGLVRMALEYNLLK
jgi:DNA-binding NarL/FixJ family response regulator